MTGTKTCFEGSFTIEVTKAESLNYAITSFTGIYLENNIAVFITNPSPKLPQTPNINKFIIYQI